MEPCVCKHDIRNHFMLDARMHCRKCIEEFGYKSRNADAICKTFKLDNLKLIEDLAKERNLV